MEYTDGSLYVCVPQAGYERKRVVCVRSDSSPPAAFRIWAPPFCSRLFVRELHLHDW